MLVFSLAFTILLLNTDIYVKLDKVKMSFEDFVKSVKTVMKDKAPPEVELREIYDSIKQIQIKALKSNDLTYEDHIFREVWDFVILNKKSRKNVLELVLPAKFYSLYQEQLANIKIYISQLLSEKINQIIQNNFFFLIENNYSNIKVVEELYDTVIKQLQSRSNHAKLNKITEHYFQLLKIETNSQGLVRNQMMCWMYLSFCLWFRRVYSYLPEKLHMLVELFRHAYPFFLYVLKDRVVLDSRRHLEIVHISTKYSGDNYSGSLTRPSPRRHHSSRRCLGS
jgi:hypothetical protein